MKKEYISFFLNLLLVSSLLSSNGQQHAFQEKRIEYRFESFDKGSAIHTLIANKSSETLIFNKTLPVETVVSIRLTISTNSTGKFSLVAWGAKLNPMDTLPSYWILFKNKRILASQFTPPQIFTFSSNKLNIPDEFVNFPLVLKMDVVNGGNGILQAQIILEFEIGKYVRTTTFMPNGTENDSFMNFVDLPFSNASFDGSAFLYSKFAYFYISFPKYIFDTKKEFDLNLEFSVDSQNSFEFLPLLENFNSPDNSTETTKASTFTWFNIKLDQGISISLEGKNSPAKISLVSISLTPTQDSEGFLDRLMVRRGNSPALGIFMVALVWGVYLWITKRRIYITSATLNR
ncbi:MAG: hypothetical protein D6732_04100 [Methanobacteriota archaeon]|nr:MAG: hypothetical protein D6732_04100 [Euryarchaeota archaeon]